MAANDSNQDMNVSSECEAVCEVRDCERPCASLHGVSSERCVQHLQVGDVFVGRYGVSGKRPKYCAQHRQDGMVSFRRNKKECEFDGCKKQPSFGPPKGRVMRCGGHREKNDINFTTPPCEEDGCTTGKRFGYPDGKPQFCSEHKKEGMKDLRNKKRPQCEHEGCKKTPSFRDPNSDKKKLTHCADHKLPGMIDPGNEARKERNRKRKREEEAAPAAAASSSSTSHRSEQPITTFFKTEDSEEYRVQMPRDQEGDDEVPNEVEPMEEASSRKGKEEEDPWC